MSNGRANWEQQAEIYKKQGEALGQKLAEAKDQVQKQGGLLASIWGSITDFFAAGFTTVWSGFHGFFASLFGKAEGFFDSFNIEVQTKKDPDWWKPVFRRFGFDEDDIKAVESMMPGITGEGVVWPFFIFATVILKLIGNLSVVASGSAYKKLMGRFTPATPGLGEVLRAAFVAPEQIDEVVRIARENGIDDKDLKMMFLANYQLQDLQTIRSVYYRMGKDENWLRERLREHGFTEERIDEIKESFPFLPTVQDLTFFLAREAFEPDMIARYGLDELYPQAMTEWAKKQGLEEDWAKKYWFAHWEHPGLQTVLEMYHRDQLTEDEMWNYFGLVEIPPFWRQKIMNISYNVITRVDARRMYQLGVIDEEKLNQLYRHMGFSPDDAGLMVEWTKHYAASQDRDLTRGDITQAYIDRDISAGEAVELLKRTGFPEDYANFIIYETQLKMDRDAREEQINFIKDRFTSRLINSVDARNQLIALKLNVERVNELMAKWELQVYKSMKLPSKTDLDKLLRASVITEVNYRDQMDLLGYSNKYITWYLQLIQAGAEEA